MTDIRKIVELHELCESKRQVARETGSSRNTVKKYIERVKNVREGKETEILPQNRKIVQSPRVVTPEVLEKIHQHLETNQIRIHKTGGELRRETGLSGAVPVEDRDFYLLRVVLAGSALKIRSTKKIRSHHLDHLENAKQDSIRA
ncbi:MAG: hypothetical protein Q7T80_14565 [Methanoregula sp.]|nr:hypothetical protein [Methanoregula sp.]